MPIAVKQEPLAKQEPIAAKQEQLAAKQEPIAAKQEPIAVRKMRKCSCKSQKHDSHSKKQGRKKLEKMTADFIKIFNNPGKISCDFCRSFKHTTNDCIRTICGYL